MAKAKETKKHETIIVRGMVKKAYIGKTKFSEEVKQRLTIFSEDFPYQDITAYDNEPDKMTPGWFKDQEGYCNLSSSFDIPVMGKDGKELSFEEWTSGEFGDNPHNAVVSVKIRQKDGAIYPVAVKVYKDGEPVDNFGDM